MAISTYADYLTRLNQTVPIHFYKAMIAPSSGYSSSWTRANLSGAIPTTSAACDNTLTGALNLQSNIGDSASEYVISGISGNGASIGQVLVCDRLVHSGGLSGTTTGAQTTNLPTAALTRYTSGVGVMIGLEIYTAIGTTATTATVSYTNQAGTAGRTTKDIVIGATGANAAGRILPCPLQDGDTGVLSVESVTLAASTVSAAGNFGVTLFKPLYMSSMSDANNTPNGTNFQNSLISGGMQFEPISSEACLMQLLLGSTGNNTVLSMTFMEIS
jgi:hypothetical protein